MMLGILALCGCVKRSGSGGRGTAGLYKNQETTIEATGTDTIDSRANKTDTVVVLTIDSANSELTVKSIKDASLYTLNYNGGTSIQNRYGTEVLMEDIEPGEVADVSLVTGSQKLLTFRESADAWENTSVSKWSIDYDKQIMTIGSDRYSYDENLIILSEGRQIDIHELNSVDSLVVKGMDKKLSSINVKTGHGYIKITDETNLLGGLIEVGTNIMTVITEDMIIVAPEGEYTLTASKNGVGGSTTVTVARNDETTVSLSAFQGEVERVGSVKLNVKPEGVSYNVFIDNKAVDDAEVITLTYGTHTLVVTSDTYTDYTEDIIISSIYMNKTIDLSTMEETTTASEETTTNKETSSTEETTTEEETTTASSSGSISEDGVVSATAETDNNVIVVSGPSGAEVYFDGVLKGTAPVTFGKVSGSHIFVLRKDGYTTKAYSYVFDETSKDVYIKFPELIASE
jgi:hypothetical protein